MFKCFGWLRREKHIYECFEKITAWKEKNYLICHKFDLIHWRMWQSYNFRERLNNLKRSPPNSFVKIRIEISKNEGWKESERKITWSKGINENKIKAYLIIKTDILGIKEIRGGPNIKWISFKWSKRERLTIDEKFSLLSQRRIEIKGICAMEILLSIFHRTRQIGNFSNALIYFFNSSF